MEPVHLYLVCQDVDLGYHVYAICSTREKAEQYIDDYFALRLDVWEVQQRDMYIQHRETGLPLYTLHIPQKEEMRFYIEKRDLDEAATL